MLILRTDPEFNDMAKGDMYQYINAIRIESADVAEGEAQPARKSKTYEMLQTYPYTTNTLKLRLTPATQQ